MWRSIPFKTFQVLYWLTVWLTDLVQQECAMTRHSSSVVHHCRDVAEKGHKWKQASSNVPVINSAGGIWSKWIIILCGKLRYDRGHSLSIGLQLADLKEHHEIIFAVAGSCLRAGHSCQLSGRYCVEKGDKEGETGWGRSGRGLVANSRVLL